MSRTWTTLAVTALLAAVFPLAAVAGGTPGQTDNKDVGKKVDDLRADIATLSQKIDGLKSNMGTNRAAIDDLRRRVDALEKALEGMPPPITSDRGRSYYPPPIGGDGRSFYPPAIAPGVGRVLLRNNYGADVTLILNNNAQYRIAAFDTREISGVPAGVLTYEVVVDGWGPRAVRSTTLAPGRAVSLVVE